jgi:hypothetical protein
MADRGSVANVRKPALVVPSVANRPSLVVAGAVCFLAAVGVSTAYFFAFDAVLATAATFLSDDGVVEDANRRALAAVLLPAAALIAVAGALFFALAAPASRVAIDAVVTWDPLRRLGLEVPSPHRVLAASATLGTLLIGMHLVGSRLGGPVGPLFRREGAFELVTVALELVAFVWCIAAARHWSKQRDRLPRGVPALYATLGVVLFIVAMEELNWGQTLLAFDTPSAWAAINYQQETSLHNLIDRPALIVVERTFAVVFGLSVLALIALANKYPRSAWAGIAPPAALGGLAMLCAIPGAYLRLEVTELLLALFFAFYSYRIYVAARSRPA